MTFSPCRWVLLPTVIKQEKYMNLFHGITTAAITAAVISAGAGLRAEDIREGTAGSAHLWGIGTSVTYPLGNQIYMGQGSYSIWNHGDLLFGFAYQNWKNDEGRSHAYTLLAGYRQFLWKGLHSEIELWPAYNPFRSSVDGKTYCGCELWVSVRVGYRFDMTIAGQDFFILAQPSLGFGIARQNRWPGMGHGFNAVFEPQLIIGYRF